MIYIDAVALMIGFVGCCLRLNIMDAPRFDMERFGLALLSGGLLGNFVQLWVYSEDFHYFRTISRVGIALVVAHMMQKHWLEISSHFAKKHYPERRKFTRALDGTGKYGAMK